MTPAIETDGKVGFQIAFEISAVEMMGWHPDRIAAFFRGLAIMVSARAGLPLDDKRGL